MHIGVVIWNLMENRGGLQRVGVDLSNSMLERGHNVSVFYHSPKNKKKTCFPLNKNVHLCRLVLPPYAPSIFTAKKMLIDAELDVLVALFSWNKLLWFPLLLQHTGIPWIISEHNNPEIINTEKWNAYERHACLYAADRIHLLQNSFIPMLPPALQSRIRVIANTTLIHGTADVHREGQKRKIILAAGRLLDTHKQFSILIHAFALLENKFSDWDLHICGSGTAKNNYEKLIKNYKLNQRIFLPGMQDDLSEYYSKSNIFCIPSRYEGFPLVLLEAQSFGLPIVGFQSCSGVNDLVSHGNNGLLAKETTPQSLANSLSVLMDNQRIRFDMGQKGKALLSQYNSVVIYNQWEQFIFDTIKLKNKTKLQESWLDNKEEPLYTNLQEILSRPLPFKHLLTVRYLILFSFTRWLQKVKKYLILFIPITKSNKM